MKVSPLRKAIEEGNLEAVISVLDRGADIEEVDLHGHPGLPLRLACFHGHAEIVAELVDRGADIFAPNAEGPEAPLRIATRGKHHKIIGLLLKHVAEVSLSSQTETDPSDRRKTRERRRADIGPPSGLMERRVMERRSTSVREVELTAGEWEAYFAQEKLADGDKEQELAQIVFERVRD